MHIIEQDGITLRIYEDKDAAAVAAASQESTNSVLPWLPWCTPDYSEADARIWFKMCDQGLKEKTAYEFGIFSSDTGELLGGAGLNEIRHQHRICNLGYWVRQSMQRKGIALRAIKALVPFAFNTLHMQRIEIVVGVGNLASEGVARKIPSLNHSV